MTTKIFFVSPAVSVSVYLKLKLYFIEPSTPLLYWTFYPRKNIRLCKPDFVDYSYRLMIDCWQTRPTRRPTFTQLNTRIATIMDDSLASSRPALPTDGFLYENEYKTDSSDSLTHISCNFPTNSPTETPVIDLKTPNRCTPKIADVKQKFLTSTHENQQNNSDYRITQLENELAY